MDLKSADVADTKTAADAPTVKWAVEGLNATVPVTEQTRKSANATSKTARDFAVKEGATTRHGIVKEKWRKTAASRTEA